MPHLSHIFVVFWVGLTFFIILNQLSDAHSGRMLFFFMSSFNRSIHLSLGLPLGRDPSIRVFRTYFATLSSSLRCTWPNRDSRFFTRKVFIGCMYAFSRMITFLMWYFLVFHCIHLSILIYAVFIWFCSHFLIAQHSPPYVIAGLLAVLEILFFKTSGTFLSQMTPDISRHLLASRSNPIGHIFLASSFCFYCWAQIAQWIYCWYSFS